MICFRCGVQGHRAHECVNSPLPREEQDRLWNEFTRMNSGPRYGNNHGSQPQAVAQVDLAEGGTDPQGVMMMSANIVEVFTEKEEIKQLREKVAYLEAAMAEKFELAAVEKLGRTEDTTVSEEPHRRRPQRGDRSESPPRSHTQPQSTRVPSPLTNVQPGRLPPVGTMDRQASRPDILNPDVTRETGNSPEWQPFVPDPYFADPAMYSQFILSASIPKHRQSRPKGPIPPKRHIKMLQGMTSWDPVEQLRKLPVTGLDYGNLFDIAPTI